LQQNQVFSQSGKVAYSNSLVATGDAVAQSQTWTTIRMRKIIKENVYQKKE
jgi:hypothetical protein